MSVARRSFPMFWANSTGVFIRVPSGAALTPRVARSEVRSEHFVAPNRDGEPRKGSDFKSFSRSARSGQDCRENLRCVAAVEASTPRGVELDDCPAASGDEARIDDNRAR
jgi:hypothetical protein